MMAQWDAFLDDETESAAKVLSIRAPEAGTGVTG
jgi:hypothetical protein